MNLAFSLRYLLHTDRENNLLKNNIVRAVHTLIIYSKALNKLPGQFNRVEISKLYFTSRTTVTAHQSD